jgi:ATP-dependent RNA helicase DeaD
MGITVPTPIQKLAIGPVLAGRDVIAKAETGTGKTLAFGAPMMSKIDAARASVLGLVLTPTRELAEQVATVLQKLGEPRGVRIALIVGGEPLGPQVKSLQAGAQVVVGTPGRVLDLYGQRFLSFPWTEFAILDEADRMLEIGFIDDVRKILSFAPEERQTLLFSATFPPELLKLAREHTRNPVEVATASGIKTVDSIDQCWMRVSDEEHSLALIRLIEQSDPEDVFLVFCDRREDVDRLMRRLERMPFSIKALHGGYDQEARFRVMSAFRTSEVKALVATDVASRGLDVVHVTHVVNYAPPRDVTDYTHRIGRTGRAGRKGQAITLVTPLGMRRWNQVLREATWKIEEVPQPGPSRRSSQRPERAPPPRRPERPAEPAAPPPDPRYSFPAERATPPRTDARPPDRPEPRAGQRPGRRRSR